MCVHVYVLRILICIHPGNHHGKQSAILLLSGAPTDLSCELLSKTDARRQLPCKAPCFTTNNYPKFNTVPPCSLMIYLFYIDMFNYQRVREHIRDIPRRWQPTSLQNMSTKMLIPEVSSGEIVAFWLPGYPSMASVCCSECFFSSSPWLNYSMPEFDENSSS